MFEDGGESDAERVLARLDTVLDELIGLPLERHTDDAVLELLRGVEQRVRRLAVLDHALLSEVQTRGLARERGATSTASFLARMLRLSHSEARARVTAASQLAPRQVAGQVLAPLFPATAAAQAAGIVGPAQARVITTTMRRLPSAVLDESFEQVETHLVELAGRFGLDQFAQLARHLHDVLDPDGTLHDTRHRDRCRELTVRQRPDGSVTGTFEGTAAFGETLLTVLGKLATPTPEGDGVKDPRSPGQRRHDRLLDALQALLRCGELGRTAGVTTTVILTMTAQHAATGHGLARTGHGASIPVRDALHDLGDARIITVELDPDDQPLDPSVRPITGYGTTHRLYTEGQHLALIARDQGCSFPACTIGPAWTQAHHLTDWIIGKRTCVDDGCLLCGYHHREFDRLGWRAKMINGIPHWLAPTWLDPTQTWQRNTAHDASVLV